MSPSTRLNQELATTEIRPKSILRKFLPSLTSVTLIVYLIVSLLMNGDITPLVRRGFFCNDSSIKYPFKTDTIGVKLLFLIALIIPAIVIIFCDRKLRTLIRNQPNIHITLLEAKDKPRRRKDSGDSEECDEDHECYDDGCEFIIHTRPARRRQVTNTRENNSGPPGKFEAIPLDRDQVDIERSSRLTLVLRRTFGDCQLFVFGFCTCMLFTGIGKITCGRFRPHFMQRCQPDVDCSSHTDVATYIEKFACTNSQLTSRDMSYITTSWPSGHAAIMFFSMTYMIVYLYRTTNTLIKLSKSKKPQKWSPLLLHVLYIFMIGLAVYIAGTRVSDYHHHALDVFSGALIGFAISLALTRSIPMRISPRQD